jgi:outer membrane lipoprotein-sorting protein
VGLVAATIGLAPAVATTGSTPTPPISANALIAKIAASGTRTISGSVEITTDLGLPSFLTSAASPVGGTSGNGKATGSSADPQQQLTQLLSGTHTLQVAADGPGKQKVSIVQSAAAYTVIRNGSDLWTYNSKSNSVFHVTGLSQSGHQAAGDGALASLTPQQAADQALKAVGSTTSVTVDGTATVAGRETYQLLITPKSADSTVGTVRIAVDSATGVPLKFTLTPRSGGPAAVDVGFTDVSFAKPAASTFAFKAPKGAKVTTKNDAAAANGAKSDQNAMGAFSGLDVLGKGWSSVAELKAPKGALSAKGSTNGNAASMLSSLGLGKKVSGTFGSGTVVTTRVVNALITGKGTVYIGAVSQDALLKAANGAGK